MSKHATAANTNAYLKKVVNEIFANGANGVLKLSYAPGDGWRCAILYMDGKEVFGAASTPSEAILLAQHKAAGTTPPPF